MKEKFEELLNEDCLVAEYFNDIIEWHDNRAQFIFWPSHVSGMHNTLQFIILGFTHTKEWFRRYYTSIMA